MTEVAGAATRNEEKRLADHVKSGLFVAFTLYFTVAAAAAIC